MHERPAWARVTWNFLGGALEFNNTAYDYLEVPVDGVYPFRVGSPYYADGTDYTPNGQYYLAEAAKLHDVPESKVRDDYNKLVVMMMHNLVGHFRRYLSKGQLPPPHLTMLGSQSVEERTVFYKMRLVGTFFCVWEILQPMRVALTRQDFYPAGLAMEVGLQFGHIYRSEAAKRAADDEHPVPCPPGLSEQFDAQFYANRS